mgnify:CR=1 FL=1
MYRKIPISLSTKYLLCMLLTKQEGFDSESEDDLDIRPTDCVLLAAKSDEDQR